MDPERSTPGCGVSCTVDDNGIALVEFGRPPVNYIDADLIAAIVATYEELDRGGACRVIVLASSGKHFCAGANFGGSQPQLEDGQILYGLAARLVEGAVPVVAAVQGRAVGAGLGVALTADFRVATPATQFVCNFARLGIHHGFGLSATLPRAIGQQRTLELLYTGATLDGKQAKRIGLCDAVVRNDLLRAESFRLAREIAASAPLAVRSIRRTMRANLAGEIRAATALELREQLPLFETEDFEEGVCAVKERRLPRFVGK